MYITYMSYKQTFIKILFPVIQTFLNILWQICWTADFSEMKWRIEIWETQRQSWWWARRSVWWLAAPLISVKTSLECKLHSLYIAHHSPRPLLLRCLELRYKHSPASDLITIPWCPSSVMVVSKVSFIKDYILKIDIWKFYILRHCWVSGWQRPCPGPSLRLSPSWIAHLHQEQSFLHHPLIFKP